MTKPTTTRARPPAVAAQPDGQEPVLRPRATCDPAGKWRLSPRNQAFVAQINLLDLEPLQIAYLCDRWLPELDYLGKRSRIEQRWNQGFKAIVVLGGVAITAFTTLNLTPNTNRGPLGLTVNELLSGAIILLGLLVAAGGALEGSFHWGERWRHFRSRSESLRGDGWAFLELTGPTYRRFATHAEAFRTFVSRAEAAFQEEAREYLSQLERLDTDTGGATEACSGSSSEEDSSDR